MGEELPEEELDHGEDAEVEERAAEGPLACDAFLKQWDRSRPDDRRCYGLKLLFAGCEAKKVRDGLHRIGVTHILVSYFYLRKWLQNATVQEIADDLGRFDFVFLDSGGFSFMEAKRLGKKLDVELDEYSDQFYSDLPRIGHLFSGVAEIDVGELGNEFMTEKKELMLASNVPIMPVIQGSDLDIYEDMGWFDGKYPYLAVGSVLSAPEWSGYLNQVFQLCRDRGLLLHGFGMTSARVQRMPWYSVDSTSWLSGSRFGTTMVFQNGRIRHYDKDKKDVRKRFRKRFEENGIIWEDVEADKGFEVDMMNALAWKQWADYLKYSGTRSYWLTAEERDKALSLKSKAFNAEGVIDRKASLQRAQFRRLAVVNDSNADDRVHETLHCDSCHLSGRCPRFKPTQSCGYDINVELSSHLDLQRAIQRLLEVEYGRVMTGVLFEKIEGGVLDANLSNEMSRFMSMIREAKDIFDPREELTIKAKGGKGSIATMLASVFAPAGSGNTPTQRASTRVIDADGESVGGER